jgi:hypothetical protein
MLVIKSKISSALSHYFLKPRNIITQNVKISIICKKLNFSQEILSLIKFFHVLNLIILGCYNIYVKRSILKKLFLFIGIWLLSAQNLPSFAQPKSRILGEKDFHHYYGPLDPRGNWSDQHKKLIFRDDHSIDPLLSISQKVGRLDDFIRYELYQSLKCSDDEFEKFKNYIHYNFRLLALSYLIESLKEISPLASLSPNLENCRLDWQSELSKCRAKSQFMKNFIQYLNYISESWKHKSLSIKYSKEKYIKMFNEKKSLYPSKRLEKLCQSDALHCSGNPMKDLNLLCASETQRLQMICSEEDKFFGFSESEELIYILSQSHITRNFRDAFVAKGCFQRFSQTFSNREKKDAVMRTLFNSMLSRLINSGSGYLEGSAFPYGSLQEYEKKGLKTILEQVSIAKTETVTKKVKPQKMSKKKQKQLKKQIAKIEKKFIELKKKEEEKTEYSALWKAEMFRQKYELERVEVDMISLMLGERFSSEQIQELKKIAQNFFSRKALQQMKVKDKIGSLDSPIPFRFVKYLINSKDHQRLFNLVSIVGNNFYILNDLDKDPAANGKKLIIQLENHMSFKYAWKVAVLAEI